MSARVLIAAIGTQGDVQPFIALAIALQRRGYDPVLATTKDFESFVTSHGVAFYSLGGDIQAFLKQSKFDEAVTKRSYANAPTLLREGQKILNAAAKQAWGAAQTADIIVFHAPTTFCIDMAEAMGIPAIVASFQPLYPTIEFPYFEYAAAPVDPLIRRIHRKLTKRGTVIDPLINRLSYMVQKVEQTYFDFPRDRLRKSLMGLRPRKRSGFYLDAKGQPVVALQAYSGWISPAPGDWPETNITTGYWRLEDTTGWQPSPEFAAFLAKGEPPIYMGFGSMPWNAKRNTEIFSRALKLWGGRAVIGKGWGGVRTEDLPDTVFVIDRAPHTQLFKHVKAVVHHGGAGTTHAGLYAGKPTFVVPQFYDQSYWGRQVYDLGCGPQPVQLKKLSPHILANALDDLSSTPSYYRSAEALAERLRVEDGPNRAVDVIEETIAEHRANRAAPPEPIGVPA
ncbi:MAG: UDP-glucose:sterol glucosyltransferase [Devosia sp.]|nr:UDP-glucose:sterol glucosyltransferase [Devosia sp.]